MSKYLVSTVETYRVDSASEVEQILEEAKNANKYVLTKYNCESKEQKAKGEVIDSWYRLTLTKSFNEEKEPSADIEISYEVYN
jgi:hypothetical protein